MKEQVYNSQNRVHRAVEYSCVMSNGVEELVHTTSNKCVHK